MASNESSLGGSEPPKGGKGKADHARADKPEWADGLKQLYDSVVDEPLPDSFKNLLAQLDDDDGESQEDKS